MREMKDSGHETIGLVPSDWTEKRLKYLCKIQTGNEDSLTGVIKNSCDIDAEKEKSLKEKYGFGN